MSQPSCTFDTCCGCIELRTGCLIIGYLSLVGEIIYIIMGLLMLTGGTLVVTQGDNKYQVFGVSIIVFGALFLLIFLFMLAFTIVLLVGVHQNKRGHVKAYLICSVVLLVLYTINLLASFSSKVTAGDIVSGIFTLLFGIYYLLVVRSYYYKMDDRKPVIYNTA